MNSKARYALTEEKFFFHLFLIGTFTSNPLRMRGGAGEDDGDDHEQSMMPPPAKKLKRRTQLSKRDSDQPFLRSCFQLLLKMIMTVMTMTFMMVMIKMITEGETTLHQSNHPNT